jgi:hypothetical protein
VSKSSSECVELPKKTAPAWILELPTGQWTGHGTNTFDDVKAANIGQYGNTGPRSVLHAWCGAALATGFGTHGAIVHYGGGHQDYYGNEVYVFDLGTRTWDRLTEPSPYSPTIATSTIPDGIYPDGTPGAPHTYHGVAYRPSTNEYLITKRELNSAGGGVVSAMTRFDLNTNSWTCSEASVHGAFRDSASSCYDSKRDGVWLIDARIYLNWSYYDFTSDTWTNYTPSGIDGDTECVVYVPTKDCVVCFRQRFPTHILDPANPSSPSTTISTAGSGPPITYYDNGVWSDKLGAIVYYEDRTSNIYLLTPPSGDFTGTWVWSQLPITGIPDINPQDVGTYGKFQLVDYEDATIATYVSNDVGLYQIIRLR